MICVQMAPAIQSRETFISDAVTSSVKEKQLTNGTTNCLTDLSPQLHEAGDHGDITVRNGTLGREGGSSHGETTSDTLNELSHDDLCIGGVCATRVNHETDTATRGVSTLPRNVEGSLRTRDG